VTSKGIESLTLLLDSRLFHLPLEGLDMLRDVGCVGRDHSLPCLLKKYRESGYQPENNNSQGISKDRVKYIFYEFREEGQDLSAEKAALEVKLKMEGISSSKKVASVGDWQRTMRECSLLQVHCPSPLLNIVPSDVLASFIDNCKCRCMLLLDKINAKKSLIQKFGCLGNEERVVPLLEQSHRVALWCGLLGVSLFFNQWCARTEDTLQAYRDFWGQMLEEVYLGSVLARGPPSLRKSMLVFVGAGHLRMNGTG
jgi:hypothetical protein